MSRPWSLARQPAACCDTQYAGWAGAAVGLLCGLAAYLLIMKSPPFAEPGADEEADENYFLNLRESSRS